MCTKTEIVNYILICTYQHNHSYSFVKETKYQLFQECGEREGEMEMAVFKLHHFWDRENAFGIDQCHI